MILLGYERYRSTVNDLNCNFVFAIFHEHTRMFLEHSPWKSTNMPSVFHVGTVVLSCRSNNHDNGT